MARRYKTEDCMMLDQAIVEELKFMICDRLTPEELIEALGVTTEQVFEAFLDKCLELDLDEVL
jgi:hypothetical protein